MRRMLIGCALALASCSPPANDPRGPAPAAPDAPEIANDVAATIEEPPARPPSETTGGDGSPIVLTPLSAADIAKAKLPGELACSFAGPANATLLLARGNVASKDPSFGLVRIGDYPERVNAPGGFDAMLKGATFTGRGTTIRIALTSPATAGGESPPRPATLTFDRADGARRVIPGRWTCGP